jgi:hypothetical protein
MLKKLRRRLKLSYLQPATIFPVPDSDVSGGHMRLLAPWLAVAFLVATGGCNKSSSSTTPDSANSASSASSGAAQSAPAMAPPVVVDAGTSLTVTIDQPISTKTNNTGDRFEASLAEPVRVDGNEVLPVGTKVRGTVTRAAQAGHLKGGAVLAVTLDSIRVGSQTYPIETSEYAEVGKTRGRRTAIGAGGGAAFGAVVGALAGGGKGAAIGAVAGGGAGTAGAAYTGDRDLSIAPETRLHFRLKRPVSISL